WPDQALFAGSVRWVGDYRKMRQLFRERDRSQVDRVPCSSLESLYAALAEHDVAVAAGEQIFRRQQPFLNRGRRSSLEQDRLLYRRQPSQQGEVLHVARTNLKHVGVFAD